MSLTMPVIKATISSTWKRQLAKFSMLCPQVMWLLSPTLRPHMHTYTQTHFHPSGSGFTHDAIFWRCYLYVGNLWTILPAQIFLHVYIVAFHTLFTTITDKFSDLAQTKQAWYVRDLHTWHNYNTMTKGGWQCSLGTSANENACCSARDSALHHSK